MGVAVLQASFQGCGGGGLLRDLGACVRRVVLLGCLYSVMLPLLSSLVQLFHQASQCSYVGPQLPVAKRWNVRCGFLVCLAFQFLHKSIRMFRRPKVRCGVSGQLSSDIRQRLVVCSLEVLADFHGQVGKHRYRLF